MEIGKNTKFYNGKKSIQSFDSKDIFITNDLEYAKNYAGATGAVFEAFLKSPVEKIFDFSNTKHRDILKDAIPPRNFEKIISSSRNNQIDWAATDYIYNQLYDDADEVLEHLGFEGIILAERPNVNSIWVFNIRNVQLGKVIWTANPNTPLMSTPKINEILTNDSEAHIRKIKYKALRTLGKTSAKFMAKGVFGYAYDLGDDTVMKITTDRSEAANTYRLKGKKFKHISDVYQVFKALNKNQEPTPPEIQGIQYNYYIIHLEKLKHDPMIARSYKTINGMFLKSEEEYGITFADLFHNIKNNGWDELEIINRVLADIKGNHYLTWFFTQYVDTIKELRTSHVISDDYFNMSNFGIKPNGDLGIYDVGFGDYFDSDADITPAYMDEATTINEPIELYHGTTKEGAQSLVNKGIDFKQLISGYIRGFYTYPSIDNILSHNKTFTSKFSAVVKLTIKPGTQMMSIDEFENIDIGGSNGYGGPTHMKTEKAVTDGYSIVQRGVERIIINLACVEKIEEVSLMNEAVVPMDEKIYYHGRTVASTKFSYDYVGKGVDQEGSGFYFSKYYEDAKRYTEDGGIVIKAKINYKRLLPTVGKPKLNDVRFMIMNAPDYKDTLQNFGEDYYEALNTAIQGFMNYDDPKDSMLTLEHDFYRNNGSLYLQNLVKLKYDGHFATHTIKLGDHLIVYNPAIIQIIDYEQINSVDETIKNVVSDEFNAFTKGTVS